MECLSPVQVAEEQSNFFVVDIRERYEYEFGNTGCPNIPMGEFCSRLTELPADKIIVLMCRSGKRASALANLLLMDYGMRNIAVLDGGIENWKLALDTSIRLD